MANIPTYAFPEVQQAAAPSPNVEVDGRGNFGEDKVRVLGAIAGASGDVLQVAGSIGEQQRQAYLAAKDQARAKVTTDMVSTADEQFQLIDHGSPEHPETGILNMRGEAAVAASQSYRQKAQAMLDDISQHYATDDVSREHFAALTRKRLDEHVGIITNHVAAQVQVAQDDSTKGAQHIALEGLPTVMYGPDGQVDLDAIHRQVARPEGSTRALAPSAVGGQARVLAWRQQAYSEAMTNLIKSGDYEGANKVFSDPDAKTALGSRAGDYAEHLRTMGQNLAGQEIAQHAVKLGTDEEGIFHEDVALQELKKVTDPVMRAKVDADFTARKNQAKEDSAVIKGKRFLTAQQAMDNGHSINSIEPEDSDWIQINDKEKWHALMEKQSQWTREAKTDARRTVNDPDSAQERVGKINALNDLALNAREWRGKGDKALAILTDKYVTTLSDKGFEAVSKRLDEVLKSKPEQLHLVGGDMRATQEAFAAAYGLSGKQLLNPNLWGADTQAKFGPVRDAVEAFLNEETERKRGVRPSHAELVERANSVLAKVKIEGTEGWFHGEKEVPLIEAQRNPAYQGRGLTAVKIPDTFRQMVIDRAKKNGKPAPNDKQMSDIFLKMQGAK